MSLQQSTSLEIPTSVRDHPNLVFQFMTLKVKCLNPYV